MIYGSGFKDDFIKPMGSHLTIDWGNSIANGLVGYWPFNETLGRWHNIVTFKRSSRSGSYPGRVTLNPAGYAMDITEADSDGQNIQIDNPIGGLGTATIGTMVYVRAVNGSGGGGIVIDSTGTGPRLQISSNGGIDQHCRIDFIPNTAYARPNTGQLTLGTVYTIFTTWVSGNFPSVYKAQWPYGALSEFTYNDRGNASGTIGTSAYYIGLNGNLNGELTLFWLGMWNRVLEQVEMQHLHYWPWQLVREDNDWILNSLGGFGSMVFQPNLSGGSLIVPP